MTRKIQFVELLPIVIEAGGRFVDWIGEATANGLSVVPGIADEVLRLLK